MRIRVSGKESDESEWKRSGSREEQSPVPEPGQALTEQADPAAVAEPGWDLRGYLLSLPERVVRSASALSAGLLREIGDATLPEPVRRSRLYVNLVEATLRFMIEQVGEVEGTYPLETQLSKDFALRRTAGNGIELVGILAFRASPVWVMAALADVSGAGRKLVREIADALKEEGLLEPDREFESVDHILDGLEKTSGRMAEAFNTPPLDVPGLKSEWAEIRKQMGEIPPRNRPSPQRLWQQWRELQAVSRREKRSVFEVSSLMGLSATEKLPERFRRLSRSARLAARRTGEVFAGVLLDHYRVTLAEIREAGFLSYWTKQFRPYLRAAASQFSKQRPSLTQRYLVRRPKPARP